VGSGDLDWDTIFALAKKANMKTYIAEVGAYGAATLSGAPLEPSDISIISKAAIWRSRPHESHASIGLRTAGCASIHRTSCL
jgi:hypothetical protein